MTSDAEYWKSLVPLYVNGRLPEGERRDFEKALVREPGLNQELKDYEAIRRGYCLLEDHVPAPPSGLYNRIRERIMTEGAPAFSAERTERGTGLLDFFRGLFAAPRLAWAVAGVQLIIIVALLTVYPRTGKYETLSGGSPAAVAGTRINVIFKTDSREREIRELLGRVGGTIVNGPSAEGLYTVTVRDAHNMEGVLEQLKNSGVVRFAEKAY
jgi:hypothetical protein